MHLMKTYLFQTIKLHSSPELGRAPPAVVGSVSKYPLHEKFPDLAPGPALIWPVSADPGMMSRKL